MQIYNILCNIITLSSIYYITLYKILHFIDKYALFIINHYNKQPYSIQIVSKAKSLDYRKNNIKNPKISIKINGL